MNKDQVKGQIKVVEGNIKEVVGKATGDKNLEVDGNVDVAVGKTQGAYGDLKDALNKK